MQPVPDVCRIWIVEGDRFFSALGSGRNRHSWRHYRYDRENHDCDKPTHRLPPSPLAADRSADCLFYTRSRSAIDLPQRFTRNGLLSRSSPMLVNGPCPGTTTVSSGRASTVPCSDCMIFCIDPPGRSVRPMEPANSVSPASRSFSAGKYKQMLPSVCPGVCKTLAACVPAFTV